MINRYFWIIALIGVWISTTPATAQFVFSRSASQEAGVLRYAEEGLFSSLTVSSSGEVKMSTDDRAIEKLSPGGFIQITHRNGLTTRDLKITSDAEGHLSYEYGIQGFNYDFDDEGQSWLSGILPEVVEKTGLGAEGRISRILKREGPEAAIRSLSRAATSYAILTYYKAILNDSQCTPSVMERLLDRTSREISSSSRLAEALRWGAEKYPDEPKITVALVKAVHEISSSSAASGALRYLLEKRAPTKEAQLEAFRVIQEISSSSAQGEALEEMSRRLTADRTVYAQYCRTVGTISSSSVQGQTLEALVTSSPLGNEMAWDEFFQAVEGISSSSVQGSVLRQTAKSCPLDEETVGMFLRAVNSISSSSQQGKSIRSLLERKDLSKKLLRDISDFVENRISSSSVRRELQSLLAGRSR